MPTNHKPVNLNGSNVVVRSYASFTFAGGPATFYLPPNTDVHRIIDLARFSRKARGDTAWDEVMPAVLTPTADGCPRLAVSEIVGQTSEWQVKVAVI
jgi:hypothetical protein